MNKMDPDMLRAPLKPYAAPPSCAARFTRQLAVFFFLNLAVVNGVLELVSPGGRDDTVLQHTGDMLRGKGGDDSWGPMAAALEYFSRAASQTALSDDLLRPGHQVSISALGPFRA